MLVTHVTPFAADGSLRPGLRVTQTVHGTCEPGSDALPNGVYRCGFANYVVDPCWRAPLAGRPSVVCLTAPWSTTALRIRLSRIPPRSTGKTDLQAEPWGIRLRSGRRCVALQGAHDTLSGREGSPVVDYGCSGDVVLVRGIDRRGRVWRIRAARTTGRLVRPYRLIGWVEIATAWYGGNT